MVRSNNYFRLYYWVYGCAILLFAGVAMFMSKTVEAVAVAQLDSVSTRIIIDAGHGGEDGGATSYTGTLESQINLEVSRRLNDLMHLLGYRTTMIRTTDTSVSTTGDTIAQRKMSDLKNRVAVVNQTDNALLVSIHQNLFSDGKYSGAQVFYAPTQGSKDLAEKIQRSMIDAVNPGSKRGIKGADGVYLMQHINCTGVLVECGFLSNPQEAVLLESPPYQKKLVCVIAAAISDYLNP